MKRRGFMLIELLVTASLLAIVSAGLYGGFIQGMKICERVESSFRSYDPVRLAFMRLDQDLRNAVYLKAHPFHGKVDSISFPVKQETTENRLVKIEYRLEEGCFIRTETLLTGPDRDKKKEKVLLKGLKDGAFGFSYQDEDNKPFFESFWLEEPYFGIPKGVDFQLHFKSDLSFKKLISIPQGRYGHLQTKSIHEK